MEFSQIRYFLAVAETLNFRRAAESCNISQPALTQAIKRLEDELGGELIVRDGRNTRLTALGRALRHDFESVARTRDKIREKARDLTGERQETLDVGIMCTIGPEAVAPLLEAFRRDMPGVALALHDVVPASVTELLVTGAIDVALVASPGGSPGPGADRLREATLYEEEMVVAFGPAHRFNEADRVTMDDVATEPYVDRLHCEFRDLFADVCRSRGCSQNVVVSSVREDWVRHLVRLGVGVSVVPRYSLRDQGLSHARIADASMMRTVRVVALRSAAPSPTVAALLDFVESGRWRAGAEAVAS